MKILLHRYHPVCEDIAITLTKLGHEVTLAINTSIKDHYGDWSNILFDVQKKYTKFSAIPLSQALLFVKTKKYDLVGLDGVFDGDKLLIDLCKNFNIPYFCIQGYPYVMDEPSDNILSLGWFLPHLQYIQIFSSEAQVKNVDWKNIFEKEKTLMKNICVFYPNFWEYKCQNPAMINAFSNKFVSFVQNYEKYNFYSYKVFNQICQQLPNEYKIENFENKPKKEIYPALLKSKGLLHLKWADQPGIAIFEAMLRGKPVYTLKSFVLASGNQEVLIDGYNAVVADTTEELVERMQDKSDAYSDMAENAFKHSMMLIDFDRQAYKLQKFLERCIE